MAAFHHLLTLSDSFLYIADDGQDDGANQDTVKQVRPPRSEPRRGYVDGYRLDIGLVSVVDSIYFEGIFARCQVVISDRVDSRLCSLPVFIEFTDAVFIYRLSSLCELQGRKRDAERVVVVAQPETGCVCYCGFYNRVSSRQGVCVDRLSGYFKIGDNYWRNRAFINDMFGPEAGNAVYASKINSSIGRLEECAACKLVSLQSVFRVISGKCLRLLVEPADSVECACPDVAAFVFTNTAYDVVAKPFLLGVAFDFFGFAVDFIKSVGSPCPYISGMVFGDGITDASAEDIV